MENDRKPWELDDEELRGASHEPRSLATAAARKALEWAAKESDRNYAWDDEQFSAYLRKELTDD